MSPVIIVKNKQVASLGEMNRLALKRIFDKDHMTYPEEALLDESVAQWPKKLDMSPEEKKELNIIIQALIDNEDGKFKWLKKDMVSHGLDYTKVYSGGL